MTRGGRRPRRFTPGSALVSCGGRWGRRRVRVTECLGVVRAEEVYSALVADDTIDVGPGDQGTAQVTLAGQRLPFGWELRQNPVWRLGRAFLRCARCTSLCTRLYLPTETSWLACRRCWGLTYPSRTLRNYKDSLWGRGLLARMLGTTQREWAYELAADARATRLQRAIQRREERQD